MISPPTGIQQLSISAAGLLRVIFSIAGTADESATMLQQSRSLDRRGQRRTASAGDFLFDAGKDGLRIGDATAAFEPAR
jgi:hypothetical protein